MVPSLTVQGVGRSLFVLVVTQHHIESAREYLAGDIVWVGAENLDFLMNHIASAAAYDLLLIVIVADDGGTLGGSVAHGIVEADVVQQFLYLVVECSSAYDYLVEVASQRLGELVAYAILDALAYYGHLHEHLHTHILYLWQHRLAHHLLDDERYHDEDAGLYVGQCTHEDGG